ncbi:MAG: hypothetical protein Q4A65_06980 [Bacillota bacterium]|nr:hypothetical protein [Bacillota bacterium]
MKENISIGIVSASRDFARALSASLLSVCEDFLIKIYETREFVREWGENNARFDLILWDGREIEDTYRDNIVYLAEKASLVKMDVEARKFSLYKYSGAAAMSAAIFEIYSSLTGRGAAFVRKDKVRLFAFGSWDGGAGCTTLSLAAAQDLRRFHRGQVLLISLESVESTRRYFQCVPELKSIVEYLYRIIPEEKLTPNRQMPFLDSYLMKDLYGVEAFAPSRGGNPLPDLSPDEIQKFIASIIETGRYDYIIVDMGSTITKAALAVMDMADGCAFVTASRAVTGREEMYLGHILACLGEDVMRKSMRITNKASTLGVSGGSESFINVRTAVRAFSRRESDVEPEQLILEGAFGEDIRNLAVMLLKLK